MPYLIFTKTEAFVFGEHENPEDPFDQLYEQIASSHVTEENETWSYWTKNDEWSTPDGYDVDDPDFIKGLLNTKYKQVPECLQFYCMLLKHAPVGTRMSITRTDLAEPSGLALDQQ